MHETITKRSSALASLMAMNPRGRTRSTCEVLEKKKDVRERERQRGCGCRWMHCILLLGRDRGQRAGPEKKWEFVVSGIGFGYRMCWRSPVI